MKTELEKLQNLLDSHGYSYATDADDGSIAVTVHVPAPHVELPDILKPYAWSEDQVERAIWKGNTTKETFTGANYELALREYAQHIMFNDPETVELEKTLDAVTTEEGLYEYQAKRLAIWQRIVTTPEFVELDQTLETLY